MNDDDQKNALLSALQIQQAALEQILDVVSTACELPGGEHLSPQEAVAFRAEHWDVLWNACLKVIGVCENTPSEVVEALRVGGFSPGA